MSLIWKIVTCVTFAAMAVLCFVHWLHAQSPDSTLWLAAEFVFGDKAFNVWKDRS